MKNVLDLRFIIGAFFLVVGILLLLSSFLIHFTVEGGQGIDRDSGIVFIIFGLLMLAMWKFGKKGE